MKIGKIISINYTEIKVRIATEIRGNSVNIAGVVYHFGNIGGHLKSENAMGESIICEVVSIADSDPNKDKQSFNLESDRELTLRPVGTLAGAAGDRKFTLGIGIYPSLYSDVSIVTHEDMEDILGIQSEDKEQDGSSEDSEGKGVRHKFFTLGESKSLINYPIKISIDKLFRIHSAVLGNSGSGKSNTIAYILQQIFEKTNHSAVGAKVILFDTNGEYGKAFENQPNKDIDVVFYDPNEKSVNSKSGIRQFYLPHFLLNLDEWCDFLLATKATQRPFWVDVLHENARFSMLAEGGEKVDDFVHYFVDKICRMIDNILGQAESDTSRISSAGGLIIAIRRLIENENVLKAAYKNPLGNPGQQYKGYIQENKKAHPHHYDATLSDVLNGFEEAAKLDYGDNKNCLRDTCAAVRDLLDTDKVTRILNKKHEEDERYSHDSLQNAAEMCLIEKDSMGDKNIRNWTSTMINRLEHFLGDPDYAFMQKSGGESNVKEYLNNFFCLDSRREHKNQLFVIDASSLPQDALEIMTGVLTRVIFDHKRRANDRNTNPIHFVLDEAHRYIKKDSVNPKRKDDTYTFKENIFEKIAREGRKYAVFLLISSQRPSELSETVLSQCGNYIVHRIQNDTDMRYIEGIMPFFSRDIGSKIRQAVEGEMVMFGHCVPMPLQIKVELADPAPDSKNCNIPEEWFKEKDPSTKDA